MDATCARPVHPIADDYYNHVSSGLVGAVGEWYAMQPQKCQVTTVFHTSKQGRDDINVIPLPSWRVESIPLAEIKLGHYTTILLPWVSRCTTYLLLMVSLYDGGKSDLTKYIQQSADGVGI